MRIFVLLPLLIVLGMSFSVAQDVKSKSCAFEGINGNSLSSLMNPHRLLAGFH